MAAKVPPSKRPQRSELIIGSSPAIQEALLQAHRVALFFINVLITGATGTGKENFARLIHQQSGRPGRMVSINCGTLRPELAEAELFGHLRGAFTGALAARPGLLELAHQGTVFLDEVGEMDLRVQAILLRTLEEGTLRPLGGRRERHVDLRFICATNRDMEALVRRGAFREDLYWRLVQYSIELPPLRDRGSDVIQIAKHLLSTHPVFAEVDFKLTLESRRVLLEHSWPGNVRELQRALWQLAIDGAGPAIEAADLRRVLLGERQVNWATEAGPERLLECLELYGEQSARELAQRLGAPKATVLNWIGPLERSGTVGRMGKGRAVTYRREA